MATSLLPVAHAGPGSVWQAMVVVGAVLLAIAIVLIAGGWLRIDEPSDLLTPAVVALVVIAVGSLGHDWLSDGIGWGLPVAVILAVALVVHLFTPFKVDGFSPLVGAATALCLGAAVALYQPLTLALHPPAEFLPLADDAVITIDTPLHGDEIPAGPLRLQVTVAGGSIGPGAPSFDEWAATSDDPEELGVVWVYVDQRRVDVAWQTSCTPHDPCSTISGDLVVDEGARRIAVEFLRGDGTPLAPAVVDRIDVTVAPTAAGRAD